MGIFDKIREGLKKTRDNISGQITQMVNSFTKIDEELFEELEELLVMGDVGMNTAQYICDQLRKKIKEKGITDPSLIMGELKAIVSEMLQGDNELHAGTKPSIILVIGVNGVGKTTTIGKLASRLKGEGKSVILGAADTFRAAAIEQLEVWADRAGVPLIKHQEGADPAAVVFDTIAAAKARGCDVIICDTAGRLHNKKNLMDEPCHRSGAARLRPGDPAGAGRRHRPERREPGPGVPKRCGHYGHCAHQAGRHPQGRRGAAHYAGPGPAGEVHRRGGAGGRPAAL